MSKVSFGESEIIEFKESLSELAQGAETLCGFANQNGGTVYFGIKNNREVIGISNVTEKTIRDLSQYIFDNLEPQKIISVIKESIYNLDVIKITIEKSPTPYHTFRKKPYIRIGTSTKLMPQEEYQHRLIYYKSTNKDYSSTTLSDYKVSDLSPTALLELRKILIDSERYDVDITNLSDEQLLKDLLLIQDGKLTIAAIILLGTESTLSKALPYVEFRFGYKVDQNEIRNQDTMIYKGGSIENIIDESKPRNKLLADILFKCELVEQFGNGVNLMYRNQLALGKNPPNYRASTDKRVTLELDGNIQDIEFAKYVLKVADSKGKDLNDKELLILHKIKNNEKIFASSILEGLLELGLIEKVGFSQYMLSKQYYTDMNLRGKYTKKKGLSRNKNKELILQHLHDFKSATKAEFAEVFKYELSPKEISNLLEELKRDKKIFFEGAPRSSKGRWKLTI